MSRIDSKVGASTLGAAAATLIWTLLAAFIPEVSERLDGETLAVVVGATATIVAAVLGYLVPNEASPVPGDGQDFGLSREEQAEHDRIARGG